jgi:VWFA-related protein
MPSRTVIALLAAALCNGALSAQQTPPPADPPPLTFRVEVNYVEVDAYVTDAQGNVLTDLKADDFELLEDGKPQTISSFSPVEIPVERAERPLFAAAPIEADVQTNKRQEGRVYLFVLDDLHTEFTRTPRVKAAARRFIERNFGTNDVAAVVFTGGRTSSQDFTNNTRLLLAAIDRFNGRKIRSATLERLDNRSLDPATNASTPGQDPFDMERGYTARSAMNTLRSLSEFMAGVRGRRKAMLLISEGVDYNIFNVVTQGNNAATSVLEDTREAIAAAQRGNVSIYAIDPRGLATGAEDLIEVGSTMPEQGVGASSIMQEQRLAQDSLRVLSAETGGFAAVNRNDFTDVFDRIVRENSSYYVLGYYSTNERRDGRYRKLNVRVKRPGAQVRHRNGYIEARGRKKAPAKPAEGVNVAVAEALGSPLPVAGVPIDVFAAAYKGTAPNAAVAFAAEIGIGGFNFTQKDGTFNEQLNLMLAATDSSGKLFPGDRHKVTLALKPETYARAQKSGVRILTQLNLPPGRYQVRLAAGNNGGVAGSTLYDIEVPDFYKAPFAMSGVTLTSTNAGMMPTIKAKDPLGDFLPGPPTTVRVFDTADTIALFAEIYENGRSQEHKIDLRVELRDNGGKSVRSAAEERSSSEIRGSGGYGFSAEMPLDGLTPGLYVLHVEAQSRAGDRPTVSRDIQVRVR